VSDDNGAHLGNTRHLVCLTLFIGFGLVAMVLSGCVADEAPPPTSIASSPTPEEESPSPTPTVTIVEVTPPLEEGLPRATLGDVSPGRYIAVCGYPQGNQRTMETRSLYLMTEDGTSIGRLFDGTCGGTELLAGRSILAIKGYPNGDDLGPRVGLLDPRTDKKVWIDAGQRCYEPSWSQAVSRLAMICDFNVVTVDPDSQEQVLLADCLGRDRVCNDPQWSPDGKTVSFFMATEFRPDPGIYTASGQCGDEPTACPADPEFLVKGTLPHAWAPSGDVIAYVTFEGNIGIVDQFGRRVQEIKLPIDALVTSLAWSPGGDSMAISMQQGESADEIYLLSYPEGELTQLSDTGFNNTVEFWVEVGQ